MDPEKSMIKAIERSIMDLEEKKKLMIEQKRPIIAIANLERRIEELNRMKEEGKWLVRF